MPESPNYNFLLQSISGTLKTNTTGNGMGYTNVQAIKNRMSRYGSDGHYISPFSGLPGLVATEKNGQKRVK